MINLKEYYLMGSSIEGHLKQPILDTSRFLLPVLAIWFLFITASGSKTLLPSVTPFLVTLVLLFGLTLVFHKTIFTIRFGWFELYASLLAVFGFIILLYGIAYGQQARGVVYLVKFLSLALFLLVFSRIEFSASGFFKILLFVFFANVVVLLFAIWQRDFRLAGTTLLLREGLGDRIFTTLNMGGMLWKTAFMALPGLVYLCLKSSNFMWWLAVFLATAVMGIDGSRTGLLFLALFLLIFLPAYWWKTGWQGKALVKISIMAVAVLGGLLLARPIAEQHITRQPLLQAIERAPGMAFGRFVGLFEKTKRNTVAGIVPANGQDTDAADQDQNVASSTIPVQVTSQAQELDSGIAEVKTPQIQHEPKPPLLTQPDGIELGGLSERQHEVQSSLSSAAQEVVVIHNDQIRLRMVTGAIEKIMQSPFFGGGIESTVVMTVGGPMVAHLSYLQVWGDYGLIGILLFVAIMLIPISGLLRRHFALLSQTTLTEKAGLLCAAVIVVSSVLYGFMHPLSSEFSEWAPYLIALCVTMTFSPARHLS